MMDDDIRKIASTVLISRKTLRIVKQNIVFALAVKSSCTFAWCNWCGEHVGSSVCRCRSICFGNFELNAGDENH